MHEDEDDHDPHVRNSLNPRGKLLAISILEVWLLLGDRFSHGGQRGPGFTVCVDSMAFHCPSKTAEIFRETMGKLAIKSAWNINDWYLEEKSFLSATALS